jgi:hypothetical protein
MTTMTRKQAASEIRAAVRAAGFTSRQVAVYMTRGEGVRVVVRDLSVPFGFVQGLAARYERVSRCEMTGEILCGGNLYVSADVDSDAIDAAAAELEAKERDGILLSFMGRRIRRMADARNAHCPYTHDGKHAWSAQANEMTIRMAVESIYRTHETIADRICALADAAC